PAFSFLSKITTQNPSRAKRKTTASPIPPAPPLTTAILLCARFIFAGKLKLKFRIGALGSRKKSCAGSHRKHLSAQRILVGHQEKPSDPAREGSRMPKLTS